MHCCADPFEKGMNINILMPGRVQGLEPTGAGDDQAGITSVNGVCHG